MAILWVISARAEAQIQDITSPKGTIAVKTRDGLHALIDVAAPPTLDITSPKGTIAVKTQAGLQAMIDVAAPLTLSVPGSGNAVVATSEGGAGLVARSGTGNAVLAESGAVAVYAHNTTVTGNVAYLGSNCCAGDFYGNVSVHGTLTKAAGSFRIDHPLDPGGKYLNHSFVESPDMMNVYNGNVVLDERGRAVVQLPSWFEALNGEYRYQLTPLGAPAPNLYVAQEIAGNRFVVAGGPAGGKVSWQVTGIRHDAYANAHRIPVEEEKPLAERGTYLFPELAGKDPPAGLRLARYPEVRPVVAVREAGMIPVADITGEAATADGR
jgi:hypothetical protein